VVSARNPKEKRGKIVGGTLANTNQIRYQVSIQDSTNFHFCGGSIIDAYHIATAAHCFDSGPSNVHIQVGTTDVSSPSNGKNYAVSTYKLHPKYATLSSGALVYDVCLLTLASPITFDDSAAAIPFATKEYDDGTVFYSSGWGATSEGGDASDQLLWVDLAKYNFDDCLEDSSYDDLEKGINLCAGGVEGKDTCQGDSGGPLVFSEHFSDPTDAVLTGVVSFGLGCARAGVPGVYADVKGFGGSWFHDEIASQGGAGTCRVLCLISFRTCKSNYGNNSRHCRKEKRICVDACQHYNGNE
jgi:transmembrane serine protease 3